MAEKQSLERLGNRLFGEGQYYRNVLYYNNYKTLGEIDLYGFKDDELWLIEFKSNDRLSYRKKARNQLFRAEKYATIDGVPYNLVYAYPYGYKEFMLEVLKGSQGEYKIVV